METSASLYPQQKEGNGCNAESSSSPTDCQSLRARLVAVESASSHAHPSLLLNPDSVEITKPEKARWARTRADGSLLVSVGPIISNLPSLMSEMGGRVLGRPGTTFSGRACFLVGPWRMGCYWAYGPKPTKKFGDL